MTVAAKYDPAIASEIIAKFGARPELLVQILNAMLARYSFISDEAVHQIADELNLSRADVHGVVSYYHDYRREPAGRTVVKICQAEACQAMGSRTLTAHAESSLGIRLHETDADGELTLEPAYCLGNCACSPAIMIGERVFGRVTVNRFDDLIAGARSQ